MPITLSINRQRHSLEGDPAMPLLWYLRDELRLTGTKYGCGIGSAAPAPYTSTDRRYGVA